MTRVSSTSWPRKVGLSLSPPQWVTNLPHAAWQLAADWCVPPETLSLGEKPLCYPLPDNRSFDPGPCPNCGQRNYRINWLDVGMGPYVDCIPGSVECLNPECEWGPGRVVDATLGEPWVGKLPPG